MKKINWFKVLFLTSLIFVAVALYKADYLIIPNIYKPLFLVFSFIFLLSGYATMSNNWKDVLKVSYKINISLRSSIVSNGLSIFTKYIPGKVMVIMGRALYISQEYKVSSKKTSVASLKTQLITLLVGITFGFPLIFFIPLERIYVILALVFILCALLLLFSQKVKEVILYIPKNILKKNIDYPILTLREFLKVIPSFLLNWAFWSLGFFFLAQALSTDNIPVLTGLSFPLAATIAILTLIAPGGLGVREGILAFCLISIGLEKQHAITISAASRLWFLIGEILFFITALIIQRIEKAGIKTKESTTHS